MLNYKKNAKITVLVFLYIKLKKKMPELIIPAVLYIKLKKNARNNDFSVLYVKFKKKMQN
jgi:hypothetical protein